MRRRKRLTQLERKILTVFMTGKTNKEIAGELGCTEQTVKDALRSALQKFGIDHSRQVIPRVAEILAAIA